MTYLDHPSCRHNRLLAVAAFSAMLAACSGMPRNPDIDNARAAIAGVRGDPTIARNAPLELEQADQALRRAESFWADERDEEETARLAYLARQRGAIARNLGTLRQNEERLQGAGAERERLRAQSALASSMAAQREAATAQQQAASAQQQAASAQQQATLERERAAALQRELELMEAKNTERGMVLTLQDVLFESGRATLSPASQRTVERLAGVLAQHPERRLLIEGFTDNVGSVDMNMDLSRRRAEAFRMALVERGVAIERLEVRAYGPTYPVADNGSAAGRMQNRRVEVLFSDAQGKFIAR